MSNRLEFDQYAMGEVTRVLEKLDATGFQFNGEVYVSEACIQVEYNGNTDNHELVGITRV